MIGNYIQKIKIEIIRSIFKFNASKNISLDINKIKNVLILQNRHIGIGDLVLSTGAIYELANKYPHIIFTYLSIPAAKEIFSNYPTNVKVIVFENKLFLYGNNIGKNIRQFIKANWYGIIKNIIKLRKEKYAQRARAKY